MGDERLPKHFPNAVLTAFCKKMGGLTIPLFEVKILPETVKLRYVK